MEELIGKILFFGAWGGLIVGCFSALGTSLGIVAPPTRKENIAALIMFIGFVVCILCVFLMVVLGYLG